MIIDIYDNSVVFVDLRTVSVKSGCYVHVLGKNVKANPQLIFFKKTCDGVLKRIRFIRGTIFVYLDTPIMAKK